MVYSKGALKSMVGIYDETIENIKSSSVESIWREDGEVFIAFKRGAVYKYLAVTDEDWKRIRELKSGFGKIPRTILSAYKYIKM